MNADGGVEQHLQGSRGIEWQVGSLVPNDPCVLPPGAVQHDAVERLHSRRRLRHCSAGMAQRPTSARTAPLSLLSALPLPRCLALFRCRRDATHQACGFNRSADANFVARLQVLEVEGSANVLVLARQRVDEVRERQGCPLRTVVEPDLDGVSEQCPPGRAQVTIWRPTWW